MDLWKAKIHRGRSSDENNIDTNGFTKSMPKQPQIDELAELEAAQWRNVRTPIHASALNQNRGKKNSKSIEREARIRAQIHCRIEIGGLLNGQR